MIGLKRHPGRPALIRHGDGDVVAVSLSSGVAGALAGLGDALGEGFLVLPDAPEAAGVAVVGPVGVPGVAFLKVRHPRASLLVVDYQFAAGPDRATAYLDAGADGYLAGVSVREVAAQVRALARRRGEPGSAAVSNGS